MGRAVRKCRVEDKNMTKQFALAATFSLGLLLAGFSFAAEPAAPKIGDKAPDFTLAAVDGKAVSLSKLSAAAPVALVVLRGYPGYQCPICSMQVADLVKHADELKSSGAEVVLVYPGPAENLGERAKEFVKGRLLPENFSFVTDPDYKFTESYGLRWDAPRETAYPSTFVIDKEGIVRYAKISKTHGGRAKTDEVLKALSACK
jgi:peroxiredoxin